jgi:hypothetical protein
MIKAQGAIEDTSYAPFHMEAGPFLFMSVLLGLPNQADSKGMNLVKLKRDIIGYCNREKKLKEVCECQYMSSIHPGYTPELLKVDLWKIYRIVDRADQEGRLIVWE